MTELRTRMIRDMTLRGFSSRTHESYIAAVVHLARHYRRSPEQLTNEEVQAYLLHLVQHRKLAWATCSLARCPARRAAPRRVLPRRLHPAAKPGFLFPVRALAQVFRAKYLEALARAAAAGTLALPDSLSAPGTFHAWLASLRQQAWVVYAKPPFAGPEQVLQYLGRYTHRVALANDRLVDLHDGVVRFRWKDYSDGDRVKIMALPAAEFIRRFLPHIVPERFVRIRHFGFLANRARKAKLERCRQLLGQPRPPPAPTGESVPALMLRLAGIDIERCHVCGLGRLGCVEILRPTHPARLALALAPDTS